MTNREAILAAVTALAPYGYGVPIRDRVQRDTGRDLSFGTIYAILDELEEEGLVGAAEGPVMPHRGGRRVIYFLPK